MQAPTCKRLQPSLILQPLLEGSSNPLISFTTLSWKGATTPCSRLPASPGRELLPPDISTSLYWQKASTFILKASTLRSTKFLQFLHQTYTRSSSFLFADLPRDSSFLNLEILNLHHIHRCIIDSDLSELNHADIS